MEVIFQNPGVEEQLKVILGFQSEAESAFWSEPLFYFYPQLDRQYAASLPFPARTAYIESTMRAVYDELAATLDEKAAQYAAHWQICKPQIVAALSEAFAVDCSAIYNDLCCHVGMCPIEPRFLQEKRFNVFYRNSERGAIGECIHEIIHFVWFYVWNRAFGDSYDEYERPSMKWILSEMVVESVMKDQRLSSINPYFPREQGGCIYPYFFDMRAGGALILDTLDEMYHTQSITDFMKNSYAYCLAHEQEIREHIRRAEEAETPS